MDFQILNKDDPEKVFRTVKNAEASLAMAVGSWVCYDEVITTVDGVRVVRPETENFMLMAGVVVDASIAAGAIGRIQIAGLATGLVIGDGAGNTDTGDYLKAIDDSFNLDKAASDAEKIAGGKFVIYLDATHATGAAAALKTVFIRGLL